MESRHTIPATFTHKQPLISIRPISAEDTYALRQAVLWPNKPLSYVQLPDDPDGQHFGAFVSNNNDDNDAERNNSSSSSSSRDSKQQNSEESLVSIISLFDDGSGAARFRKFATAQLWQGKGVGSALLSYTIEAAARNGATSIWCDARQSALGFYERFGMSGEGEVFFKGEVPYLRMSRALP
ncbi:GCN5-like N-acetyltransferase [Daldinia caldariorum]|uniref:GCN5-like N-acetyltransferase n=1 Tax=Daldinia caldariorum TaxID=326644 RepID=UPI002007269F|nr:GCN5-like N-acetyltransferase [Daldinia caldariorum]KAI1472917.1 GCN5-like N-acetyltransferase [Daldinia caldariorum]